MKKFKVAPQNVKRIKAIIAAAMTLALAVPTTTYLSSKAATSANAEETADLPQPVMSVDFEKGFMGEKEKNGLEAMSTDVLEYEELKDDKGNYKYDDQGHQIYDMTDTPVIQADKYKYTPLGNQPTTVYDKIKGNVLGLDDTVEVKEYKKEKDSGNATVDAENPVGTVLQQAMKVDSQVKLNNPFKGMDLSEEYDESLVADTETGWTKGVSMSYWVKAATDAEGKGVDSSLIVFNNKNRKVIQKDDLMKYQACQEFIKNPDDARFSLGKQEIMTDADGKTYNVYSEYGPLVRLNQNYPLQSDATEGGGWYEPTANGGKESDGKITVTDSQGNQHKIASFASGTVVDSGLFNSFAYLYAENDDLANGYSSKSKVREEVIEGSLSISVANDFVFRVDDYDTETLTDGSVKAVDGATISNPNSAEYNTIQDFEGSNQLYFDGDETVVNNPETWHYVTVVLQNDWVSIYVDGQYQDPEEVFSWWRGTANEADFNMNNAGKTFNGGRGIRGIFAYPEENVEDWSVDGTANISPANGAGITMLDWLTDENTELFIGGNGVASDCVDFDIGNKDGTLIDDLEFYNVPLTEDQAVALYNKAKSEMEGSSELPAELESFTFEDGSMTGTNKTTLDNAKSNVADPKIAVDPSRGNVLALDNSKSSGTSAVVLSKNPFEGQNLSAATINYWVKEPAGTTGSVAPSVTVSFSDTPKVKNYDKMGSSMQGKEDTTLLYTTTAGDGFFYEGATSQMYAGLTNNYLYSTKRNGNTDKNKNEYDEEADKLFQAWTERLNSMSKWHMVTVIMRNSGLEIYMDGELLPNNLFDNKGNKATFYGPRFYDGYYVRIHDGFKAFHKASNNQGAWPLMSFVTDPTTSAYIGWANKLGSATTYERTYTSYFDDIRYYADALTQDQIKAIYEAEKKEDVGDPEDPSATEPGGDNSGQNPGGSDNPAPPGSDIEKPGDVQVNEQGDTVLKHNKGLMQIIVPKDVMTTEMIEKLTFGILGTADAAADYAKMDQVLKGITDFVVKRFVVYTVRVEDNASYAPNGKLKVSFKIPDGYAAENVVVVGEDGTIYEGVLSDNNTMITIETSKLGNYAVAEKDVSTDDGSVVAPGTTTAGKTGDTANVVIPFVVLAIAGAAIVVVYKKKAVRD